MKKVILLLLTLILALAFIPTQETYAYPEPELLSEKGEFRGTWITPFIGSFPAYSSEAGFKQQVDSILNNMEANNLNVAIVHMRTHNNALYKSELNPVASWFSTVNFNVFDPMEYFIEEAHKRGIEFHAWLNPYRVSTTYQRGDLPAANPQSNAANLLTHNGAMILNPALPVVRDFVVDSILEIVENYNVDAIHFDDYFYFDMGGSSILDQPDQTHFLANPMGFPNTIAGKADWRREQINIFVESVSNAITNFNENNNKFVQFGISPTGIHSNGNGIVTYDPDGKPITTGSATQGQTHYSSYLFADSVKWVSEGWLDYILPQSYWAYNHPQAAFPEVMGWWDKVVRFLPVNLYSGIGIYLADQTTTVYDWGTNPNEFIRQLEFLDSLDNVQGFSIYSYNMIRDAALNQNKFSQTQLTNARNNNFPTKTVLPELKSMTPVYVPAVGNINHNAASGALTFDGHPDAKFYYIYKSSNPLTYEHAQIVDVIPNDGQATLTWASDDLTNNNFYGVRALSHTNHLSSISTSDVEVPEIAFTGTYDGTKFTSQVEITLSSDESILYSFDGASWQSYTEPISVISNGRKTLYYKAIDSNDDESDIYVVRFEMAIVNSAVPTITINGDMSGTSYISGTQIEITAPDNEIWVRVNRGSVGPWELYEGPITLTTTGNYAIFAKTVDPGGVESEIIQQNLRIVANFQAPTIEIAGDGIDPNYDWLELSILFDSNAPDPSYRINGGAWTTYIEPLTFETVGSYTVEYRNGTTEPVFTKSFNIVPAPGEIDMTLEGASEAGVYIEPVTVTLEAQNPTDTISYRIFNGVNWTAWQNYTSSFTLSNNVAYRVAYKAISPSGLESEETEVRIEVNIPVTEDNPFVIRNGENVYYYQTNTPVELPTSYTQKANEIRAVWVATVNNIDIAQHNNEAAYKATLISILDRMKALNFNTMFFQTRPMNDAFYPSDYAPMSRFLSGIEGEGVGWDVLEFLIEEGHKRGIEIHAWMNPYRVSNGSGSKASQLALLHDSNFAKQNPSYVIQDSNGALILNPGIPAVREYLYNIIEEIMTNYRIDGVHFDDYFYSYSGTANAEDEFAFLNFNPDGLTRDDWRRENVNILVRDIFNMVEAHNASNDMHVKFGISPFGIWRNRSQDPLGSNSQGLSSYSAQFADSRKWVKEGWLHYIMPQLYWPFNHSTARFADLVDWWVDVVKDTGVELVIGQGFYRYIETSNNWPHESEFLEQLRYMSQYDEITGSAIFSYRSLNSNNQLVVKALERLSTYYWTDEVPHTWETHMNDTTDPDPDPDPQPEPEPDGLSGLNIFLIVSAVVTLIGLSATAVVFTIKKRP